MHSPRLALNFQSQSFRLWKSIFYWKARSRSSGTLQRRWLNWSWCRTCLRSMCRSYPLIFRWAFFQGLWLYPQSCYSALHQWCQRSRRHAGTSIARVNCSLQLQSRTLKRRIHGILLSQCYLHPWPRIFPGSTANWAPWTVARRSLDAPTAGRHRTLNLPRRRWALSLHHYIQNVDHHWGCDKTDEQC